MQFEEKLWKMSENIEILNVSQKKEEKTSCVRIKLSYYKVFYGKFISEIEKKLNTQ